jgi:hypothetical protein
MHWHWSHVQLSGHGPPGAPGEGISVSILAIVPSVKRCGRDDCLRGMRRREVVVAAESFVCSACTKNIGWVRRAIQ